jgi:prepilin-type processing-associated H-X9-DG protein
MRHRGLGNVAFVDAHAEAMTLKQLGYELNEKSIPLPVPDPTEANVKATNRLWTGLGRDQFADERERAQPP